MKIIRSAKQLQKITTQLKTKSTIGLVPTMGYLHEGHLSLIDMAKKHADKIIVSIFVNPTQFGPNEDLSRYPRNIKKDLKLLKEKGVDFCFLPDSKEMYSKDHQTWVDLEQIPLGLCGAKRPGHFRGVATVVLKLFMLSQADVAVFGKKDFQQLALIKTMAQELNVPIKIIGAPLIREKDGLAMSSRNVYLTVEERQLAVKISQGLKAVKSACQSGELRLSNLKKVFLKTLGAHPLIRVDYFECRNKNTLQELKVCVPQKTLVACAVFVGKTRLIDNLTV